MSRRNSSASALTPLSRGACRQWESPFWHRFRDQQRPDGRVERFDRQLEATGETGAKKNAQDIHGRDLGNEVAAGHVPLARTSSDGVLGGRFPPAQEPPGGLTLRAGLIS